MKMSRSLLHKGHALLTPDSLLLRLLLLLVFGAGTLACSAKRFPEVWSARYIEAAREQDRQNYDAAREHYDQLLKHAPTSEKRRLILYRMALMDQERELLEEALAGYELIWQEEVKDEYGARAMRRALELRAHFGATPEQQRQQQVQMLERYPNSVAAEHAIRSLRKDYRRTGESEWMVTWLDEVATKYAGEDLEDFALFERARVLEQDLGDDARALEAYERVIALAQDGKLADDAIWLTAQVHIRHERWREALVYLDRLVAEHHEKSWFIGDYNSEFADEARYESGRIYAEELEDDEAAIAQYEKFIEEFPHSLLRDDAAWEIVRARKRSGQGYERALERFVSDYPESRYTRRLSQGEVPE